MTDLVDAERRLNDATPGEWDKCVGKNTIVTEIKDMIEGLEDYWFFQKECLDDIFRTNSVPTHQQKHLLAEAGLTEVPERRLIDGKKTRLLARAGASIKQGAGNRTMGCMGNKERPIGEVTHRGSYYMTDTSKASQKQVGGGHYVEKSIQPWDYIVANNLGYLEGNVVKYVTRYKSKNGKQDLEKALHYLQKLLEVQK